MAAATTTTTTADSAKGVDLYVGLLEEEKITHERGKIVVKKKK